MTNRYCPECQAILREIWAAHRGVAEKDRRAVDAWLDSGRDLSEFYRNWFGMFADDASMQQWVENNPQWMEARRRKAEHEVLTGHSVALFLGPRPNPLAS